MFEFTFKPTWLLALFSILLIATTSPQDESNVESNQKNDRRLRILITNDDGIQSSGLIALVDSFSQHHDVVVCAPDSNRSGASQSVPSLTKAMTIREMEIAGASQAIAVSGSPADAVCYAIVVLGKDRPFDLVVSGINSHSNVGDQSHASGTVGAAMEGVYRGVPSIAVSQGGRTRDYSYSADFTARFVEKLKSKKTKPGLVYSINVPANKAQDIKGVKFLPMGGTIITIQDYKSWVSDDGERKVQTVLKFETEGPAGTDSHAFFDGYITVTPLQFDWTARNELNELKSWGLSK